MARNNLQPFGNRLTAILPTLVTQELEYIKHTGSVTVTLESQEVVELGTILYERSNVKGDALMAFLSRSGTPLYVHAGWNLCNIDSGTRWANLGARAATSVVNRAISRV